MVVEWINEIKNVEYGDEENNYLNEGKVYSLTHNTLALADGASSGVYLKLGASSNDFNAVLSINSNGSISASLIESATALGSAGSALTFYNRNRNSSSSAAASAYYDPGMSASGDMGTVIQTMTIGATGNQVSPMDRMRWILAPNTNYVLYAVNTFGAACDVGFSVDLVVS